MTVQAISWVLEHSKSQGATRCVLMSIANHVGHDGEGWAYVKQIMKEANCSEDTYRRSVQWGVEHGELAREVNRGAAPKADAHRKPNHFRLVKLAPADCPPADCPPQSENPQIAAPNIAPPEPSPVLEPKNSLSPESRVRAAFDLLVERDFAAVENPRHPRAVRRACRQERTNDGTSSALDVLASKFPAWSVEALANAVSLGDEHAKVEWPDCDPCGNSRWSDPDAGPVTRCPSCWPIITENRRAS